MYHAFYSPKQAKLSGVVVYRDKDDNEIYATQVSKNKKNNWPDAQYKGEVYEFVRRESRGDYGIEWHIEAPGDS